MSAEIVANYSVGKPKNMYIKTKFVFPLYHYHFPGGGTTITQSLVKLLPYGDIIAKYLFEKQIYVNII